MAKGWLNPVSELPGGTDEAMGNMEGFQTDFWGWVQGDLSGALFPDKSNYRNTAGTHGAKAQAITALEGFNKYIGRPRLRQLRTPSLKCGFSHESAGPGMGGVRLNQWAESEIQQEEMYEEGCFQNPSAFPLNSFGRPDETEFTQTDLVPIPGSSGENQTEGFTWGTDGGWESRPGSLVHWNQLFTYPSSGYSLNIPADSDVGGGLIEGLKAGGWLDLNTRAIFLEYVLYNTHVDLYTVGRATIEFPATGASATSSATTTLKLRQSYSGVEGIFWACVHTMMFCGFVYELLLFVDKTVKQFRRPDKTVRSLLGDMSLLELLDIIMMVVAVVALYLHVHGLVLEYTVDWKQKETFPADAFWLGEYVQWKNRMLGLIAGWRCIMLLPHLALIDSKTNEMYRICNGMIAKMSSFLVILVILMLGMAIMWHFTIGPEDSSSPTFMMGILNQYQMLLGGIAMDLPLGVRFILCLRCSMSEYFIN